MLQFAVVISQPVYLLVVFFPVLSKPEAHPPYDTMDSRRTNHLQLLIPIQFILRHRLGLYSVLQPALHRVQPV